MNIPAVAENVAAMTTIRKLSRTSLEKRSEKESIKKIIKKQRTEQSENNSTYK